VAEAFLWVEAGLHIVKEFADDLYRLWAEGPRGTLIEMRFPWIGRDQGMVGQGVAWHDGTVLHSVYPKPGYAKEGECARVAVNDATTGDPLGQFLLPSDIKHAGGLAVICDGEVLVSDTHVIYRIDLNKAMKDGNCDNAVLGRRELDGIHGSTVACDPATGQVFIAEYSKSDSGGTGHYFDAGTLLGKGESAPLSPRDAARTIKLPSYVQGAAWDKAGNLWLSRSQLSWGELVRVDPAQGRVLERHDTVAGIEDIEFDGSGKLWSLSETGAQPYEYATAHFPEVFRLDVTRLDQPPQAGESRALAGVRTDTDVETFCQSVVDRYAANHGMPRIDVEVTRNVPNACTDAGVRWWEGDRTIYINPDFVNSDVGTPDALAGTVLHEAAHAWHQDAGYTTDVSINYGAELSADVFAARAMEELGYDKGGFADLLKTFGGGTGTHPDGLARATVVQTTPTGPVRGSVV
jgi:hypothetical protein